jgi:hypothetical protein
MFAHLNGFYAGFFSGAEDNGVAVFVFRNGVVAGADFAGTTFDGKIVEKRPDGSYSGAIAIKLPAGGRTVQGVDTGPEGISYQVDFNLPVDFAERSYFFVDTPLGGVNVRLQKLRNLGDIDGKIDT